MNKLPRMLLAPAWGLVLACGLLLTGCAPLATPDSTSSALFPEDDELPAVSSAVTPENRTEDYVPLLAGLWEETSGEASYLISEDGTGSVFWTESETLQAFTWCVLADTEGYDLLYLFFDGADAAVCYLPVFDEDSMTLCDPEDDSPLISLAVGSAQG